MGDIPLETFDKGMYESIGLQAHSDSYEQRPTAFTGYPMFMAFLDLFLPESSAVWWSVFLCDMAAVLSIFIFIRSMNLSAYWALFAAASYGLSPLFVKIGSLPMTDILTGALGAWCWFHARHAHLRKRYAVLLGLGLGYAVLVRLTNVFFFIPVVVTLLFQLRQQRWWWLIFLSGTPVALFWAIFNYQVYGSPISNGYGEVENLFGAEHFLPSIVYYGRTLLMLLFPMVLILFPFSLFFWDEHKRDVTVAWVWVVLIFGFHAFYYASYENWWILRYTLAAWPALLYGSVLVVSQFVRRIAYKGLERKTETYVALFLAVAAIGYGAFQVKRTKAYEFLFHEGPIITGVNWINENTDEGDVFLSFQTSGSMFYYTNRAFVRFERMSEDDWNLIKENAMINDYTIYGFFHLFEFDSTDKAGAKFGGSWEHVSNVWPFNIYKFTNVE
ncbi:hypothetical protein MLD52_21790 [Puniceicoccaceae bacterium K14]|nr:hypothetical protein [Puniceicoccaceae bacterium K14]